MNLIRGGKGLDDLLSSLAEQHSKIAFAVAWASPATSAFEAIHKSRGKIRQAVIGTHFYQTHPDVLDKFVEFEEVRFVLQPNGVFHPKVFLFWSEKTWDVLIGSANLTKGAMTINTELMIHMSSKDSDKNILVEAKSMVSEYWAEGEVATEQRAMTYRSLWGLQQKNIRQLKADYSDRGNPPIDTKVMSMPWHEYLNQVRSDSHHGLKKRCELLMNIKKCFDTHVRFEDIPLGPRKTIAGLPNDWNQHWAWFGSMKGAGYFHQAINQNNGHIAAAVDLIPSHGKIQYKTYQAYIDEFKRAFPRGRDGVGVASRLLAMKRPDQFLCLDSKNRTALCEDFGIKQTNMSYERYWKEIISRIRDSVWWNTDPPVKIEEYDIWTFRTALLDAIFYRP